MTDWVPVYKLVHPAPERGPGARNQFAALYRALLMAGVLSDNAHTLLNALLNESNNKAKSVQRQVWWIAAKLGWGFTKVKDARRECEELGLLVKHNRRAETSGGIRMRANRYGFTWTYELLEMVNFGDTTMMKHCGSPEIVYLDSVRREIREQRRDAAVASGKAQAQRLKACVFVEEAVVESDSYVEAERRIRERFAGDTELETFAVDHLDNEWPRHAAIIKGRQIAGLDISEHSKEMQLRKIYDKRPELLELALVQVIERRRE